MLSVFEYNNQSHKNNCYQHNLYNTHAIFTIPNFLSHSSYYLNLHNYQLNLKRPYCRNHNYCHYYHKHHHHWHKQFSCSLFTLYLCHILSFSNASAVSSSRRRRNSLVPFLILVCNNAASFIYSLVSHLFQIVHMPLIRIFLPEYYNQSYISHHIQVCVPPCHVLCYPYNQLLFMPCHSCSHSSTKKQCQFRYNF